MLFSQLIYPVVSYLKLEFKFQITDFFEYAYCVHMYAFTLSLKLSRIGIRNLKFEFKFQV